MASGRIASARPPPGLRRAAAARTLPAIAHPAQRQQLPMAPEDQFRRRSSKQASTGPCERHQAVTAPTTFTTPSTAMTAAARRAISINGMTFTRPRPPRMATAATAQSATTAPTITATGS